MLALLSQDDFIKLKKDIHDQMDRHINTVEGKIEEIAASEEEEDQIVMDLDDLRQNNVDDEDDAIITSVRTDDIINEKREKLASLEEIKH